MPRGADGRDVILAAPQSHAYLDVAPRPRPARERCLVTSRAQPIRALALFALLAPFIAAPALAQGYDGAWFGTVDCAARDAFDRGSTQANGRVANNVLTLRFGGNSVSGRIVDAGAARLLRLEGSLARGGFATFDGVIVTPTQIHARGVVGETACNLNLTPAGARGPAQPERVPPPSVQREIPPAPPSAYIPPKPNTQPAPAPGAAGKFAAPTPPPPERPRAGASIQAPQPIDRPAPGGTIQGVPPPPAPAPTAQAPQPAPRPAPPAAPAAPQNPQVADRLACALAGTCGAAPARP